MNENIKGGNPMKNKKVINVLSSAALAVAISAVPYSAWAEDDDTVTVDMSEIEKEIETEEDVALVNEDDVKNQAIYFEGDLFNFLHTLVNQLQWSLDHDDMEQANLFVDFAEKQIEKAEELIEEGNEAEAAELLQKAAELMEKAEALVEEDTYNEEQDEDTDAGEEDTDSDEGNTDEEDTDSDEEESEEDPEDVEEDENDESSEEEKSNDEGEMLEAKIGQNVIALKLASMKVTNERAKFVLERNMNKSLERLEAKYGDISALKEQLAGLDEEQTAEESDQEKDSVIVTTSDSAEETAEDIEETIEEDSQGAAIAKKAKEAAKAKKQEAKAKAEQAKAEAKVKKKAAKAEAKAEEAADKGHGKNKDKEKGPKN